MRAPPRLRPLARHVRPATPLTPASTPAACAAATAKREAKLIKKELEARPDLAQGVAAYRAVAAAAADYEWQPVKPDPATGDLFMARLAADQGARGPEDPVVYNVVVLPARDARIREGVLLRLTNVHGGPVTPDVTRMCAVPADPRGGIVLRVRVHPAAARGTDRSGFDHKMCVSGLEVKVRGVQ